METPTANTDSTTTPAVDLTIYWETLYFSVGPLTCLIAASRGQRAWAKWEILLTLAVAGTFAYRPELILNTVVCSSKIKFIRQQLAFIYSRFILYR